MDIFSHVLWVYVPFRNKEWLNKALFFAILPDISYLLIMLYLFFGTESAENAVLPGVLLSFYNLSHSFVALGLVALVIWKLKPKILPALSAWFIHICMDIPFHHGLFGTKYLYPIFPNHSFEGISWADYRILMASYTFLAIAYLYSIHRENEKNRMGDNWKTDWLDKLHTFAGNLIKIKPTATANAARRNINRTFEKLSGKNQDSTGQGED